MSDVIKPEMSPATAQFQLGSLVLGKMVSVEVAECAIHGCDKQIEYVATGKEGQYNLCRWHGSAAIERLRNGR